MINSRSTRRTVTASLTAIFILLIATRPVFAGGFVLHPAGFGPDSYSAWKAGEGLPDDNGNANQALYFQKMTTTATFAAGVAVFKGFEGLSSTDITGLKFYYRDDGWCGAGAPRFNVLVQYPDGSKANFFSGCSSGMLPTGSTAIAPNGHTYIQQAAACYFGPPFISCTGLPAGTTIVSISIVFDEGTDEPGNPGFTFLDNIEVDTSSVSNHIWSSASDNGNSGDPSSSTTIFDPTIIESLLGAQLSNLYLKTPF